MSRPRKPLTDEQRGKALTALGKRLAEVQTRREELDELEGSLKTQIRELAPHPGEYHAGPLLVVITTNRRFNETKARALLRADLHELVCKQVFDSAKLKVLFPDVWEQAQTVYDNKVGLKVAPANVGAAP